MTRLGRRALAVCLLSTLTATVGPAAAAGPSITTQQPGADEHVGVVRRGQPLFWGPQLVGLALQPACASPCFTYAFEVADDADRLRIAIDSSTRGDCYDFALFAPGAEDVATASDGNCPELFAEPPSRWDMELLVDDPQLGEWRVRVTPFHVENWGFRMRAALEDQTRIDRRLLTPNLRPSPPYEFGFNAPANPDAGEAVDRFNEAKDPLDSCTTSERSDPEGTATAPVRCLRFSVGVFETGAGPLDLLLNPDSTVTQRIHRGCEPFVQDPSHIGRLIRTWPCADGSEPKAVPAGSWAFDPDHGHNHYLGFVEYELYRVIDASLARSDHRGDANLEKVSQGHKVGYNPRDQRFNDWNTPNAEESFEQDPAYSAPLSCAARAENCITLSTGWGDHYRWQRPQQYVDFPTDGGGFYVVRVIVDGADRITETSNRDNTSYALIQVDGDTIKMCERGLGESPWDPRVVPSSDFWWSVIPGSPSVGC